MEIIKVWAYVKVGNGRTDIYFFDSKEEALADARHLARADRKNVTAIFETMAVETKDGYEAIWSEEFPTLDSFAGCPNGGWLVASELEEALEEGQID